MKNTFFKLLAGFVIGATAVGGYAIAIPSNVPVVKARSSNAARRRNGNYFDRRASKLAFWRKWKNTFRCIAS